MRFRLNQLLGRDSQSKQLDKETKTYWNTLSTTFKTCKHTITQKLKKMELRQFTKSKMENKQEELTVTVNMYSSNIIFNRSAISHLGLKTGDKVVFAKDQKSGNWYFFRTQNDDSFALRRYAGSNMLAFSCKNLCKQIIRETNEDAYKVSMNIGKQSVAYDGMDLYKMNVRDFELDEFFNFETQKQAAKLDPSHQVVHADISPAPAAR